MLSAPHERRAGILLHPTSLAGPWGVGDLGPAAFEFLDWAAAAGLELWQILPVGPTGLGDSPYSALSGFAGSPLWISIAALAEAGWIAPGDGSLMDPLPVSRADFRRAGAFKDARLRAAWARFPRAASLESRRDFERFVEHPDQREWLEDWARYAALKLRWGGSAWFDWPAELRDREPASLERAGRELAEELGYQRFLQFVFFRQWDALRLRARARGIAILGDLPFYPAHDSADVWAHRELFQLDPRGQRLKVAGVPPDYFSQEGQLWGNPLYDWARLAERHYDWWIGRLRASLRVADEVRIDHFRAFVDYWEVDAEASTAVAGRWVAGPGMAFFDAARRALGALPLVAEDLGDITPEVRELREELGLPGMRVLQFGIADPASEHHPGHHVPNSVVYTGTHDNDTTRGWLQELDEPARQRVLEALGADATSAAWRMIETAWDSVARTAVAPAQDVLELGSEARMNRPGVSAGNWDWRLPERALSPRLAERLRRVGEASGRVRGARKKTEPEGKETHGRE